MLKQIRRCLPVGTMFVMLGLLFAPVANAYWLDPSHTPTFFYVANGNYPWGIYSDASTPDPNMSCGQFLDGNAIGMGVYSEYVQIGIQKWNSDSHRKPYVTTYGYDGTYHWYYIYGDNFAPASYHILRISGRPNPDPSYVNYEYQPILYLDSGPYFFQEAYLSAPAHSSYTGIESSAARCLTGYSQFQENQYQPSPNSAFSPWCYNATGIPLENYTLPYGPCVDGAGKQWWIGN